MANVSRIFGFRPRANQLGAVSSVKINRYYVQATDATLIGVGDLVKLDSSVDADGVPAVTRAAANNVCVGPVIGVEYTTPDNLGRQYRPALTAMYVLVADDPNIVMEAQEDAVGGALAAATVGLNVNFVVADASTVTGQSQMQVDTNTADTTNTLPLRIVGFIQSPENEVGSANAKVLVAFNTHQYRSNTGSTGV